MGRMINSPIGAQRSSQLRALGLPLDTFDVRPRPRPFVKMAGGKTKLLPELLARVPKAFNRYYEPFVGGGALYFELVSTHVGKQFVIGDTNRDLVVAYREVRDNPHELIRRLSGMKNDEKFFYDVRAIDLNALDLLTPGLSNARAARMIYLNKTCFNGLHRMNKAGRFNTPFGKYAKPLICDRENILACSKVLRQTRILSCSFDDTVYAAGRGDFVYFDPPYAPLSETSNFSAYGETGFKWVEQIKLCETARALKKRGVNVLLSNSNNPFIRELYARDGEFKIETVHAPRSINATGKGRGKIAELLIS